jgi:Ca-activated chloride channel family protein
MIFNDPVWLIALPLAVIPFWIHRRHGRTLALRVSNVGVIAQACGPRRPNWPALIGPVARTLAILMLILALARPQSVDVPDARSNEGIDIVLAVDTSGSMRALDFQINGERQDRLEVVKDVIGKFIERRVDDRIGMVVFGTQAFTQVPLTLDHQVLHAFLRRTKIGMAGDATAIGDALATATKRVKDIDAKSRVVILLTDGSNTAGAIDPRTAAQAAAAVGVRVYTIGVGSKGKAPMPVEGFFGTSLQYVEVDLDEGLLREIAEVSGGQYFRASDTESLVKIYDTIDQLEKRRIETKDLRRFAERFGLFVMLGLAFLAVELLWRLSLWRRIPA